MIPSSLHFLRPEWLLALFPATLIVLLAARRMRDACDSGWTGLVDAHLLSHLTVTGNARRRSRGWLAALAAALVASVLAMAGPAWEKLPTPVYDGSEPTVIVLSLAHSMDGTDLVPSRLARAGHKLRDMLDHLKGGDVALVIYADRPFVAAPLTADAEIIRQMLPELSTNLMPGLGNRLDLAIGEAQGLLSRAGAAKGRIVVIADDAGLDPAASLKAAMAVRRAGYQLSILGVGTTEGADLRSAQGRTSTAKDGSAITAPMDAEGLTQVARAGGGEFSRVTPGDNDIARLLPEPSGDTSAPGKQSGLVSDSWNDAGYLFLLLPVLLAPFAFRRGLLFALALMLLGFGLTPSGARADAWSDLFQTPDQQGQSAFDADDFAGAAKAFASPVRKAAALYRAGKFDAAAKLYASLPDQTSTPAETYNLGNALAKSGRLEEALAAYDKVLAAMPDDADARFNRDLVTKLLEQQERKPQGQGQQARGSEGARPEKSQTLGNGGNPSGDRSQNGAENRQEVSGQPDQPHPAIEDGGSKSGKADADEPQTTASRPERPDQMQDLDAQVRETAGARASGLKAMLNRLLAGNGTPDERTDRAPTAQGAGQPLDQATEEQLRAVPDDPSGLLRARIHQYYARLGAAGQ